MCSQTWRERVRRSPAWDSIASMSRLRWSPTCPFSKRPEERVGQLRRRRVPAGVADHEPAAGLEDPRHLVDRPLWVGEVVQRGGTDERREAAVVEGQRIAWSEHELDVGGGVGGREQAGARELEHAVGQVDPDGSLDARGHVDHQRARTAG
jgi:hypothetical protein